MFKMMVDLVTKEIFQYFYTYLNIFPTIVFRKNKLTTIEVEA